MGKKQTQKRYKAFHTAILNFFSKMQTKVGLWLLKPCVVSVNSTENTDMNFANLVGDCLSAVRKHIEPCITFLFTLLILTFMVCTE